MKTKFAFIISFLIIANFAFAKKWTITNSSTTFSPNSITINLGDTVIFSLENVHNVLEVSQQTWEALGTTPLSDGFSCGFGGGTVLPAKLGIGTHYYVCTSHISADMRGQIIVQAATGIEDNQIQANYKVFPNPAIDQVDIKAISNQIKSNYSINDISGKQIINGKLTDNITSVDIRELPKGLYIIVIGDRSKQCIKLVKE
jgi:plastocyanin